MVPVTRSRPAFRRFALALAAAQLLAYALAPALEARTERSPGPVHIESAQDRSCLPVHSPDACLACQLMTTLPTLAAVTRVPVLLDEHPAPDAGDRTVLAPRPPPPQLQTRAPPVRFA